MLVHLTVSPTEIETFCGENAKFVIVTNTVEGLVMVVVVAGSVVVVGTIVVVVVVDVVVLELVDVVVVDGAVVAVDEDVEPVAVVLVGLDEGSSSSSKP